MLQCLERDMFFTLDDDFPLLMHPPVDANTKQPMTEQFGYPGQENKSTGIMAIKYLITGGEGKECEFLDCGVILKDDSFKKYSYFPSEHQRCMLARTHRRILPSFVICVIRIHS